MTPARLRTISRVVVREGGSDRPDWRDEGVCVTWTAWPWDPWHPDEYATSTDPVKREAAWAEGRALCNRCPVITDCLEDALDHESGSSYYRHGMRGGLDDVERANLARSRQRRAKSAAVAERTEQKRAVIAALTTQGRTAAEISRDLGITTRQVVRYRTATRTTAAPRKAATS